MQVLTIIFTQQRHKCAAMRAKNYQLEQLLVSYNASKNRTPYHTYDNATPFTPSMRRNQYTGQRFTTHASSLSALSSLPRELLEPVVAVDDLLVLVVDVYGVVAQQLLVHGLLARGAAGDARLLRR